MNCAALDVESRSSRRRRHPYRVVAVSHIDDEQLVQRLTPYVQYVCIFVQYLVVVVVRCGGGLAAGAARCYIGTYALSTLDLSW